MMPTKLDTHGVMWMGELFYWDDRGFFHYRGPAWSRRCASIYEALSEACA